MSKNTKKDTLAQQAAESQKSNDQSMADKMKGTVAGEIWDSIKDLSIEMFALPNQFVHMHCRPLFLDPSKLHLVINSSAVLPSLEVAVGKGFSVELADKYVVVSKVAK